MGTIIHKWMMGSAFDDSDLKEFEGLRERMEKDDRVDANRLIGPVQIINFDKVFVMLPDGSKLGWDTHDAYSEYREEFQQIVNKMNYGSVWELHTGETYETGPRLIDWTATEEVDKEGGE